jgi:hypothetical protein
MRERKVSKRQLQKVKKEVSRGNGIKIATHNGLWKLIYNGVTYITDKECKEVITTYYEHQDVAEQEKEKEVLDYFQNVWNPGGARESLQQQQMREQERRLQQQQSHQQPQQQIWGAGGATGDAAGGGAATAQQPAFAEPRSQTKRWLQQSLERKACNKTGPGAPRYRYSVKELLALNVDCDQRPPGLPSPLVDKERTDLNQEEEVQGALTGTKGGANKVGVRQQQQLAAIAELEKRVHAMEQRLVQEPGGLNEFRAPPPPPPPPGRGVSTTTSLTEAAAPWPLPSEPESVAWPLLQLQLQAV